jgi:hypothetical protein
MYISIYQQVDDITCKNGKKMRRVQLQDEAANKVVVKLWNDTAHHEVKVRDRMSFIGFEVEQDDIYPAHLNSAMASKVQVSTLSLPFQNEYNPLFPPTDDGRSATQNHSVGQEEKSENNNLISLSPQFTIFSFINIVANQYCM